MKFQVTLILCTIMLGIVVSYDLSSTEINKILTAHNNERHAWGLPSSVDLTWDSSLAAASKIHAETCVWGHSSGGYGENIAYWGGSGSSFPIYSPEFHVTEQWIGEEVPYWSCKKPWDCSECLHLTQIIWKTTTKVGCGLAKCGAGTLSSKYTSQYFVCRYTPAGNYNNYHPLTAPSSTAPNPCVRNLTASTNPPPPPPPTGTPTATPSKTTSPTSTPSKTTSPTSAPSKTTSPTSAPIKTTSPTSAPTAKPASNPITPPAPYYAICKATFIDYSYNPPQTEIRPCSDEPWYSNGKLYCDCNDPEEYSWLVVDSNCMISNAITDDAVQNTQATNNYLSVGAWIGIGVGAAAFVIIIVGLVVVVVRRISNSDPESY